MENSEGAALAVSDTDRLRGEILVLKETLTAVTRQRNAALDAAARRDADVAVKDMALQQMGEQFKALQAQVVSVQDQLKQLQEAGSPQPQAESETPVVTH